MTLGRRFQLSTACVVSVVLPAIAQVPPGPPPAAPPQSKETATATAMLEVHLKIVQELYGLSPEQVAALRPSLNAKVPAQLEYESQNATTLRRLTFARAMLAKGTEQPVAGFQAWSTSGPLMFSQLAPKWRTLLIILTGSMPYIIP